ncbi:MAG: NfeD family protein, partial [Planctomycetota bacterium]
LPGFGVFGVGGLALTILGVVLMSQTFVIPRNAYQLTVLTKGVWIALGGFIGIGFGLIAARLFLPRAALASGLAMAEPEPEIEQSERLAVFDELLHQTGTTTTPLRPAGKARFEDRLVAVVSDGSAIEAGQSVRVIEVLGNRVTVEATDN